MVLMMGERCVWPFTLQEVVCNEKRRNQGTDPRRFSLSSDLFLMVTRAKGPLVLHWGGAGKGEGHSEP